MAERTNRRREGGLYEARTADWLCARGYRILERNFRCRIGEIDLIAAKDLTLVFVEVKFRANRVCGEPEEAVHPAKQRRIYRTAQYYLTARPEFGRWDCRFDVAAYRPDGSLTYYPGAFGGI